PVSNRAFRSTGCAGLSFLDSSTAAIEDHRARLRRVVAFEQCGAGAKLFCSRKPQQALEGPLEVFEATYHAIEASPRERHEIQPLIAHHRLDGQADGSFALPDGHRNVRLAVDGVTGEYELFAAKARIGEELGEQEGASRTLLARGDAQIAVAEIIDAIDICRI